MLLTSALLFPLARYVLPYDYDILASLPISTRMPTFLTILDHSERLIYVYYSTYIGDIDP